MITFAILRYSSSRTRSLSMIRLARTCFVAAAVALLATSLSAQRRFGAPVPEGLSFRFLGPAVGNRIASVAGIPGDPSTYYAGAASGGVWKTIDGGTRWTPVSDSMPVTA